MKLSNCLSIYRLYIFLALIAILSSCKEENIYYEPNSDDDTVRIEASVLTTNNTRGYTESGDLTEGTYYFIYPYYYYSSTNIYCNLRYVDFGAPESPTTGYVYNIVNGEKKDFKWKEVAGEGKTSRDFYLHNINPDYYTSKTNFPSGTDWRLYTFNTNSKYYCSPLDKINGENDLLLGTANANVSNGRIHFDMKHALSLLQINIEVYDDGSEDSYMIDLENAELSFGKLYKRLSTLNIVNPSDIRKQTSGSNVSSGYGNYDMNSFDSVMLVNQTTKYPLWSGEPQESVVDYEGEPHKVHTYTTLEFIAPPQVFSESDWPVLTLKIPKKDYKGTTSSEDEYVTLSGAIPRVMFDCDEQGNITSQSPITTALISGHKLNITATINSPGAELTFAPAKVEQWVSKGSYSLNLHQAGIYSKTDFNALVKGFQDGDKDILKKYGYQLEDGTYIFQLWSGLTFNENDDIKNTLAQFGEGEETIKFIIFFNGCTVTIKEGNGEEKVLSGPEGQYEFYNLVTGNSQAAFTGITTEEDLKTVIELCNSDSPDLNDILKYGVLDNRLNNLKFIVSSDVDFTISIEDYVTSLNSVVLGYNVIVEIQENSTVTVKSSAEETINFVFDKENSGRFTKFMLNKEKPGIEKEDDLYFLIDCYNLVSNENDALLKPFGKQNVNNKNWTFYVFYKYYYLDGDRIFLSMIQDNGKPKYNFNNYDANVYPTIESKYMRLYQNGYTYLQYCLSGAGYCTSLSYVINNHKSSNYGAMWIYGFFKDEKWTFPLTCNAGAYSTIFNTLTIDPDAGFYDFDFSLVNNQEFKITGMPVDKDSDQKEDKVFSSEEAPDALKKLILGTYWDD